MKKLAILLIIITLFISSCGKNEKNNLNINIDESKMVNETHIVNYLSSKDGTTINGKETQSIEGNIYYIDDHDNISKIDENTGEIKSVIDEEGKVVDFYIVDKRIFYYINNEELYNLYFKDDLGVGEANPVPGVKSEFSYESSIFDNMVIDEENIFYIENNKICKVNISKGDNSELYQSEKIDLESVINIINEKIYFTGNSGDKLLVCSINVDDENPEVLVDFINKDLKFNNICKFYNDSLYFVKKDSVSRLIKIDPKGAKKTIFTGFDIEKFEIFKDNIYILAKKDSSNELFISNKEGKNRLIESTINDFYVNDEGIFYIKINGEKEWGINKANLQGENKELLALFNNGNILSVVAHGELIYYTQSNGGLFRYNINNREIIQLEDNVSKLYKEGDSIVYEGLDNAGSAIYLANVIGYITENNIDETTIDDEEVVEETEDDVVVEDEAEIDVDGDDTDNGTVDDGNDSDDTDNGIVDESEDTEDTDGETVDEGEDTEDTDDETVDESEDTEGTVDETVDNGNDGEGADDSTIEEDEDSGDDNGIKDGESDAGETDPGTPDESDDTENEEGNDAVDTDDGTSDNGDNPVNEGSETVEDPNPIVETAP